MAVITPQTDVILLKVPLEMDETNQLTFANAIAQYNYFNALTGKLTVGTDFTYQRKDGTMRIGAHFDDLIGYNYVMYRNDNYSNKWFYAFITGMEYLNDGVTAVSIKTDVWQTWQFDLSYKRTFVEREHVNDDTVGNNTIDEGLELGEYVINSSTEIMPDKLTKDSLNNTISWKFPIVFQVSELTGSIAEASYWSSNQYNGVFSGLYYFGVTSISAARSVISIYDAAGKGDAIVAIFLAPKEFFDGAVPVTGGGVTVYVPSNSTDVSELSNTETITRPSKVNNYTPKNNKLFVYPFSYVAVDNNAGITATFRYEDFTNATPKFYLGGALGQGCTVKLVPMGYKYDYSTLTPDNEECFNYGVTGAKYPVCAWASDYYTNWVTQNAMNVGISAANTLLGAGMNASVGNVGGAASGLLSGIGGIMAQHYQAQVHPDQAKGNTGCSDILIGWQRYFTVNCMSVRAEVARTIDNYFDMFGYKVNRVKIPNVTGRTNWNFVKTIGCYIEADIPQSDLQEIKDMFDRGVTFWHNPLTFADYSQSNAIVT